MSSAVTSQSTGLARTAWPSSTDGVGAEAFFRASSLQALVAVARRVAPTDAPILITGDTGTGKEVLARFVHRLSLAPGAFVPFNCTSTSKDMLESQLFGHRRGAFTGATDDFPGVIRAATRGTLFLDEIGDMALDVQPKLLRFLESGEIHPVGEARPQSVDVRVIAATNAPLDALAAEGRFRGDLFYRLDGVRLHLPPLRDRRSEIPALAAHYLERHAREYRKGAIGLHEDAMDCLLDYDWPGNIRQLANEMRRLAALAEPDTLLWPEHLSPQIAGTRRSAPALARTFESTEVVVRLDQPLPDALRHLQRAMLRYALEKTGGRIEQAAVMLGVSRKGLYLKRRRYGIASAEPADTVAIAARTSTA